MNQNKLIAQFMGVDIEKTLQYHNSWDWLMPVANEIIKSRDEQNADWDLTDLKYALCTTNIEYVYKAVVEFIEGLSVEPDTKAIDEAFFAGFCHALEYVKREIENVDDIEHEVDESVGDLNLSGTISIQASEFLDADGLVDEVMRKYERDTTKDGSNV